MEQLSKFIADHYMAAGMLVVVGVYAAIFVHGLTGSRRILKAAYIQYTVIVVMVLCTPFLLWALTTKPN